MQAHDTVESEPPASSLPDSWPTDTVRITHVCCFGLPRLRARCYAAADNRYMEGTASPVPASLTLSLTTSAGTDVQVPGWRGGAIVTSLAGLGHRDFKRDAAGVFLTFDIIPLRSLSDALAIGCMDDKAHTDSTGGCGQFFLSLSQLVKV